MNDLSAPHNLLEREFLSPIDQRVLNLLIQYQDRYGLFPNGGNAHQGPHTVIVAVSGGADSVTLLHLLTRVRKAWSLDLVVAHLDHGLRPDSVEDARFVGELATAWGLPWESETLSLGSLHDQGNLEAAARRARYRFLAQVAARYKGQDPASVTTVAVGHTANDQAETVLMNLIRGSGLDGLAGMRPSRPLSVDDQPVPGVWLVRPLLGVSRTDILQYLHENKIPWREDPTNQDQRLVRNRIRHDILPQLEEINPQIVSSLCRTASILSAEADRANAYNQQVLRAPMRHARRAEGTSRRIFDLAKFREMDVASQRALLRSAGLALGQQPETLRFDAIERLRGLLLADSGAGGPFSWLGELMVTLAHDSFSLHHEQAEPYVPDHPYLGRSWLALYGARVLPVSGELTVGHWSLHCRSLSRAELSPEWVKNLSPWEAYIDAGKVGELLLTGPKHGQRFEPFGLGGRGKALSDYFTDRKVIRSLRSGWPIVLDSDSTEVVWVGGHQIADWVRITEHSREILHLSWEPASE